MRLQDLNATAKRNHTPSVNFKGIGIKPLSKIPNEIIQKIAQNLKKIY